MTIFAYSSGDFPIGTFGLYNDSLNIDAETVLPSLLSSLFNQSLIPSRSYGYLAGAVYRKPFTTLSPGSLIIGGYDASRMKASTRLRMAGGFDEYRPFLFSLEGISTGDGKSLLETQLDNVALDSQITNIWLPLSACLAFEEAFGLVWDETYKLYLLDDAKHSALLKQNASVTFTLSNGLSTSKDRLNITLPYGAFDLQTTFPLADGKQHYYFPLNRSADDTQYVLGRTILQEMYIVADYEAGNIDLYEAVYPDSTVSSKIVTICPQNSKTCKTGGKSKLSAGAIAGVAIGAAALLILFAAIVWYKCRGPKNKRFSWKSWSGSTVTDGTNRDSTGAWARGLEKPELEGTATSPELDSGYTSQRAFTGSASGGAGSHPRDARSVAGTHETDGRETDILVEAGGEQVHEMTAWEEQSMRNRAELPGSTEHRHEMLGSTTWPNRPGQMSRRQGG